ncbi:hypothetical protein [Methylorubrum extorquens]
MIGLRLFGYVCLGIISAAILASAGVLAWFIADRGLPVEVPETTVLTPTVRLGGRLCIRQKVNYLRDCRGNVDRALFDAHTHRVILPPVKYERPPQGLGSRVITTCSRCRRSSSPVLASTTPRRNTPATLYSGTTGRSRGRRTSCDFGSKGLENIKYTLWDG